MIFTVFGAIWIAATDILLYRLVDSPRLIARLETVKGWTFVLLTAALIYVMTRRGVGDLARINAKTSAVVSSISDGVLVLDQQGSIEEVNPAAARILGVADPQELLGMGPEAFSRRFLVTWPDGRQVAPGEYVSQRAVRGEQPQPYKAVLHPPGKPPIALIVTGAPVRPIPDGPVAGAVSVFHDVTPFEDIDRMRDSFVSSAAHTLMTPIAIIRAQLEVISSGSQATMPHAITRIARQCEKISRVTDNLLVLARLRSHSLRLDPEPVDVSSVVAEAAETMKQATPDHGLTSTSRARPIVFADKRQLGLVVRDLIELAYRRARPYTDVAVCVDEIDSQGRVSVSYEPTTNGDIDAIEPDEAAGYGGLRLERYVCEQLVTATNGALGTLDDGRHRRDWVAIPTIGGELHA